MNYWAVGQNPFWSTNAMQITVVAVMCHTLGAFFPEAVGTRPDPACREVIVVKDEMPMQFCMLSQPALADWKERRSTAAINGGSAGSNACRAITCRKSASEALRPAHLAIDQQGVIRDRSPAR
jgi:hypothetical protein